MLKKHPEKPVAVHLDDSWRSELRAYLFRIPPYYHNALKRCLRPLLPASVHSLLSTEGIEALASQCFSKLCLQKIRAGEQLQKESNERMERQERELRRRGVQSDAQGQISYGQFDPRGSKSSYLAALRTAQPPWKGSLRARKNSVGNKRDDGNNSDIASVASGFETEKAATEILGDLPADCLIPYYESRRRWIFGGSGLTTRNVFVDGVCNDGSNSQRCRSNPRPGDESLLSAAGIGVSSLNKMATFKMGDYRERLLWTRAPIVGHGSNDCAGVAGTTAPDGSPIWSVDDDALPLSFFDPKTGEFTDSVQTRVRSRLTVHFGNPFKDKRGDSLIPEAFLNQRPPRKRLGSDIEEATPMTPPGSPPQDSFLSMEGEGEAIFASPARKSPQHSSVIAIPTTPPVKKRESLENPTPPPEGKRSKKEPPSQEKLEKVSPEKRPDGPPKPPPPPALSGTHQRPPVPPVPPKKAGIPPPPKPRPPPPGTMGQPIGKPTPPPRSVGAVPPPKGPPPGAPKAPSSKDPPPKAPPSAPVQPSGKLVPPRAPPGPPISTTENSTKVPTGKAPPPNGPQSVQKPPAAPKPSSAPAPPQVAIEVQSQDIKPNVNLPPDWVVSWSRSQQRWYYFNKKTNKSVWEWPPPPS